MREVVATLAGITGALIAGGAFNSALLFLALHLYAELPSPGAADGGPS
ncbi:MAG TPA: hypothetical protein VFS92_05510 [Planctomycetota bacterium]|nr:hypothetical protein [Planctomycetota bacterium]